MTTLVENKNSKPKVFYSVCVLSLLFSYCFVSFRWALNSILIFFLAGAQVDFTSHYRIIQTFQNLWFGKMFMVCVFCVQVFDEEALFHGPKCNCNCHNPIQAPNDSGDFYMKKIPM